MFAAPPFPPQLSIASSSVSSLTLRLKPSLEAEQSPAAGYTIHYKQEFGDWETVQVRLTSTCCSLYYVFIRNWKTILRDLNVIVIDLIVFYRIYNYFNNYFQVFWFSLEINFQFRTCTQKRSLKNEKKTNNKVKFKKWILLKCFYT